MPRLPIPGSDEGTWGNVLNEYLTVAHTANGALKTDAVSAGNLQSDSVTEPKLAVSNSPSTGQLLSFNGSVLEWINGTVEVAKSGTLTGTRKQVNFIEGSNVTITTADNGGSDRVDVTIAAAGSTPAGSVTSETSFGAASAVGVSTDYARADHTHGTPPLRASQWYLINSSSLLGCSVLDPANGSSPAQAGVGTMYVVRVYVPNSCTVNNIVMYIGTAGSGFSGLNAAALYDASGTKLSETADQSVAWASSGNVTMALGAAQNLTGDTFYYVSFASNATTRPFFARAGSSDSIQFGITSAPFRFNTNGSPASFPASITMNSLSANTTAWIIGLS